MARFPGAQEWMGWRNYRTGRAGRRLRCSLDAEEADV